jgi:alpha-tubulin suppressor-like RCC1 family protein
MVYRRGFALPTVLIASVVMLMVLTVSLTSVATTRTALDSQYYQQLAREAGESGIAKAQACLAANNYVPQWTTNPLTPRTNCSGATVSSASSYVYSDSNIRTSFRVVAPETIANGVQKVSVTATTEQLRTTTGTPWRTYTVEVFATVSGEVTFSGIAFGYDGNSGAFFATVDANGVASTLGYNGAGQLGNGTTTNSVTPQRYLLPSGARANAMYTSFLSVGSAMFAGTTDGRLFGAGNNNYGQLGNGSTAAIVSTPVQYQLPAGVSARYVTQLRDTTYVLGSDNNIYAAGRCDFGQLGTNYTIAGCAHRSTPTRVNLPAVNTSNPATIPVATSSYVQSTNLVADSNSAFVRMEGGQVYGWGNNQFGQLGDGTNTSRSSPVKIGAWGDSGQPKAIQLAYEGDTLYVLDSNGNAWVTGKNNFGSTVGANSWIHTSNYAYCLDSIGATMNNGERIGAWSCINYGPQYFQWIAETKQLKFGQYNKCVDNANNSSANGNPIQTYDCNGTVAQQWEYLDNGSIFHPSTGKCIDLPSNTNGSYLQLYDCNNSAAQYFPIANIATPQQVPIPGGEKVTKITTDQWSTLFLTESGKVWGAGANDRGQLGNGQTKRTNHPLQRWQLPAGRIAVDFYTTKADVIDAPYANTYVILDDGSVWGAGANTFGQIGNGTVTTNEPTPRRMNLPTGVSARSVQSGLGTTVILSTQGRIYTVGNNTHGQLGDGTTNNSSTPKANTYTNVVPTRFF